MTPSSVFTPKNLSASEYLLALFEPEHSVAVLVRNRATSQTIQRIARVDTVAHPAFQSWLKGLNQAGADVFASANPIKEGAYSRTKENIREIRHVYLDLDEGADEALAAIRASNEVPRPNFVLGTSPGKHQILWRVDGLQQTEAESLLRSLANQFGGDPAATDSTRVLRLPGFKNRKYKTQEFVVQAHHESNQIYLGRDFLIQEDAPSAPRHLEHIRGAPASGHKSQSEQDWAYAKRALARGDEPAEVIRRIADYRAEDKPNPEYYARHTVEKASAELRSLTTSRAQIENRPAAEIDRGHSRTDLV
jgi:hypothetical protein